MPVPPATCIRKRQQEHQRLNPFTFIPSKLSMSQITTTAPAQGTQPIIRAMQAVIDGLYRSSNHYDILATHASAHSGHVHTQRHTLSKKDVLRIELRANHCEVIFKPSLNRTVLFLPYDAIEAVDHYKKVEPNNVYLYCAEKYKGQKYIHAHRGQYGQPAPYLW